MPLNFKTVIPGKLYRSGRIAPQEIEGLYKPPNNIRKIVSLDQGAAQIIDPIIKQFGIEHVVIPINPGGDVASALTVLRLAINRDILTIQNGAVLVHCARGQDRTGLAIALYRVKHGWSCDAAIKEATSEGYGSGLNDSVKKTFDRAICTACKVSHTHVCKKIDSNPAADIAEAVGNQLTLSGNIGNSTPPVTNVQPETLTQLTVLPQQSFAPFMDPDIDGAGSQVNIRASFEDVLLKYAALFLKQAERIIPKTIIDRLKKLAKYYSSYKDFERAWSFDILRGQYWHLTNDPEFKIDPYYHPTDATFGGTEGYKDPKTIGGLMVDYNPGHWTSYMKGRKYAAEIDLSDLAPGIDYRPVNRGFGAEIMVFSPEKARVIRVVPVSVALRAHRYWHESGPQNEEELKSIWDETQKKDTNEMDLPVGVGDRSNYNGISDSFLNSPSGSPGSPPNASGPVDPGGTIQL